MSSLTALSPLDGRYAEKTTVLSPFFSEYALFRFRVLVEINWLKTLIERAKLSELVSLATPSVLKKLDDLSSEFNEADAKRIKEIEKTTNHDVKAVEYFIKEKLAIDTKLSLLKEWIHFGCTSDDINNLAYGLMLSQAKQHCLLPVINKLEQQLIHLAHHYAKQPMLARTHGQPATPTTLGKEFANFAARLRRQRTQFAAHRLLGKFNGAVGNFNAHLISYPDVDWTSITKVFVENLGLECNAYTTQIEPHDTIAEFCHMLTRINSIIIDLNRDSWGYIALGYFKLKVKEDEIGSSTMPHKVNPIDFENSEGNLGLANAMLDHFAKQLPLSRWQRDLCDSTLLRNLGVACAHCLLGYESSLNGLAKLIADAAVINNDLNCHWEILAEAIQTVLRRYNYPMPYEKLKELTRGKSVTRKQLQQFIGQLGLPDEIKGALLQLTPENYLGNAVAMAEKI